MKIFWFGIGISINCFNMKLVKSYSKTVLFIFLALLYFLAGFSYTTYAQTGQCLGGGCAAVGTSWGVAQSSTSNTFGVSVMGTFGGEYNTYNVTAGQQYEWSLCTTDGATNFTVDAQLTLKNTSNVNLCYSDDLCGAAPKILWTATFTGQVRVLINEFNCLNNSTSHTVVWRCVTCYNPCSTITTISGCGISTTSTHSSSGAGWNVTACGFSTPGQERIFQFTAPTTGTYQINVINAAGGFVDYFWKLASGGCNSIGWNCINDINSAGIYGSLNFTAGTTYYILLDPEGTGSYSHTFSLVCPIAVPSCTTYISPLNGATGLNPGSVTLNWNAVSGATSYDVYLGASSPPTFLLGNYTATSASVTGFATGQVNYWRVIPKNAAGSASGCSIFNFTTGTAINMPLSINASVTVATCSATFFDSGGSGGSYANNENYILTLYPPAVGQNLQLSFTSFNTESCCDFLTIFNGNSTAAPQLFSGSGSALPGIVTASNASGALTIRFTSDASVIGSGWVANVSILPLPIVTIVGNLSFCPGGSTTINASGGGTYLWSTGATTAAITVSTPGGYSVTVTNASGCTASANAIVSFNSISPVNMPSAAICQGGAPVTLNPGVYSAYFWSNGATTQTISVGPATTTTYMVTVTNAAGCTAVGASTVTVNSIPNPSLAPATYCAGAPPVTLNSGSFAGYSWNTGATSQSITIAPIATTTYTVTVTGSSGCTASATTTIIVNNISPPPLTGASICLGTSTTLSAGGGYSAYLWSTGQNLPTITVNPNVTTNYTVTVTGASGCTATANALVVVYVNPLPVITGSVTFCSGGSTTLSASGGFSGYAWSNGSLQPNITVFTSGNYSVTVTNSAGCTGSAQVAVTQNPQLNPVITGNTSPCPGQSSFLDAGNGYAQYSWSNGATTQVINAPPGNYTVTVASVNGCTGSASANVTPLPTPVVNISGSTGICAGSSTTLSATSGFTQYVWSNGALGSLLTTAAAGTYTVTATNAQGCTASASATVSIIPVTPPSLSPAAICIGESTTLNAGGGYVNYTWSNGATGQTNTVSPASNTQYTVTVTTAAGCTASSNVVVTVFAASPPSMPNVSTCLGQGATLNAGGGYASYAWSTGQTSQIISVNPNLSTTYTVTVTNLQGCSASATATVIVNVATPPNIPAASVCLGSSVTLNAGPGYLSYQWSNGANTQNIQVSPTANTAYSVTVNDVFGCSATSLVQVSVNTVTPPTLNPVSICLGSPATLNAGAGYAAYLWSTDVSGQAIVVSPTTNTTYTVTVTSSQGCTASAAAAVSVLPLPTASAGADQTICIGQTAALSASGGSSYLWSNGQIGANISVNPVNTASYTVTVTDANNCKSVDEVTVSVYQALSFAGIVGAEPNITCYDNDEYAISFVVVGGVLPYTVNGNVFTDSYTVQNLTTPTYTITVLDAQGCVNTISGDNSFCNPSCAVQATLLPVYSGSCPDGFEVVVQSGPIQPPAYLYGISPTAFQFSPVFTGLSAGDYSVYLSTGCGVELLGTFTQSADALVVNVTVEKVGDNYVTTAYPAGGSPPYTYLWSNSDNTNSTTYSGISFTGSVTVTDAGGCTKTVSFTQSGAVGIEQPDVPVIGFTLYPNPAADRFMVAASGVLAQPALLQLYNLHGQLVYEIHSLFTQPETIPTAYLPAGLYVLNLIADGQIYTHKVWCGVGGR